MVFFEYSDLFVNRKEITFSLSSFECSKPDSKAPVIPLSSDKISPTVMDTKLSTLYYAYRTRYILSSFSTNSSSRFASLGIVGNESKNGGAATVLPFAKDLDTRTELIIVRAGEAPIRTFKIEYDNSRFFVSQRMRVSDYER